jgi:hypothetical protein
MKAKIVLLVIASLCLMLVACEINFYPNNQQETAATPVDAQSETVDVTMTPPAENDNLPDLTPTEFSYDDSDLAVGEPIRFSINIKNIGTASSDKISFKCYVDGTVEIYSELDSVEANVANNEREIQFFWTPNQEGTYLIEFFVDCDRVITESNESNNYASVTVTIPEDNVANTIKDWPEIEGLTFKDNSYFYELGNPYGQPAGNLAGVVKPLVFVNDVLTGGISLDAPVCLARLLDSIANLSNRNEKLKAVMPIDITDFSETVKIGDRDFYFANNVSRKVISIECYGSVPILNITRAKKLSAWLYYQITDEELRAVANPDAFDNYDENNAYNNIVIVTTGTDLLESSEGVRYEYEGTYYGSVISMKEPDSILYLIFAAKDQAVNMTTENIFMIEGKAVFIADYDE